MRWAALFSLLILAECGQTQAEQNNVYQWCRNNGWEPHYERALIALSGPDGVLHTHHIVCRPKED